MNELALPHHIYEPWSGANDDLKGPLNSPALEVAQGNDSIGNKRNFIGKVAVVCPLEEVKASQKAES